MAIGDLGEAPAAALDDAENDIPPAVDPLTRQMILARLVQQERALTGQRVGAAEAVRLAAELAGTLDELIAAGYEERLLLDLTPKQLMGRVYFTQERKKRELAHAIHVSAMGSRGKPSDIKKQIKELSGE